MNTGVQNDARVPLLALCTPVEKTDDINKTNDYLPNMLLTIILLQRKRLHSKLNFELCLSVMKLGKPSSRPVNAGSMYRAVVRDRVSSVGLRGWWTV